MKSFDLLKKLLAFLGIFFLLGLYVSTLICAIIDDPSTMGLFRASIYATIVIPVLLWAYSLVYKLVKKNSKEAAELDALNVEESSDEAQK